jgi:sRNA-binding protein
MNARLTPQNRLQAEELLNEFIRQFPNAFVNPTIATVHPLKLNIHEDVWEVFGDRYSRKAIARALSLYVSTPEYCDSLQQGAVRVDLAGQPCGEVTESQAQLAQQPNNRYRRFAKRIQRIHQKHQLSVPHIDECAIETLVSCRLDLAIKITTLPQQSRTVANGWQEFYVEADGYMIRVTVRPKVWKKLQQIAATCPYWLAAIRGKKGKSIEHNGFELSEPLVQIFERQASGYEISQAVSTPAQNVLARKTHKPYLMDCNPDKSNHSTSYQSDTTTLRLRGGK